MMISSPLPIKFGSMLKFMFNTFCVDSHGVSQKTLEVPHVDIPSPVDEVRHVKEKAPANRQKVDYAKFYPKYHMCCEKAIAMPNNLQINLGK